MFRFRKVRGPEPVAPSNAPLKESPGERNDSLEFARHPSVSGRFSPLPRESCSRPHETTGFPGRPSDQLGNLTADLCRIERQLGSVKQQLQGLEDLRHEMSTLVDQFDQLKRQLSESGQDLNRLQAAAMEVDQVRQKLVSLKELMETETRHLAECRRKIDNQNEAVRQRLEETDRKLQRLAEKGASFEDISEKVSRESARLTTWMAATEKLAEDLARLTGTFETTKQKIDQLHQLAEYVDSKVKALDRQKDLLKSAHVEYGKANALFLDIKSRLSQIEKQTSRLEDVGGRADEIEAKVSLVQNRVEKVESLLKELSALAQKYEHLEEMSRKLADNGELLSNLDHTVGRLEKMMQVAKGDLQAAEKMQRELKRVLEKAATTNQGTQTATTHLETLLSRVQELIDSAPAADKMLEKLEDLRLRLLTFENKLMENLALVSDLSKQTELAAEVKREVESFRQEAARTLTGQQKEIDNLAGTLDTLKVNTEALRARWLEMPEILGKLSQADKQLSALGKKQTALFEREKELQRHKQLLDQNAEMVRRLQIALTDLGKQVTGINQLGAQVESLELRLASYETRLTGFSERLEKLDNVELCAQSLAERLEQMGSELDGVRTEIEALAADCEGLRKSQEDLRLDAGEVMDLFTTLSELRREAEEKTKRLIEQCQQAEQHAERMRETEKVVLKQVERLKGQTEPLVAMTKMAVDRQTEITEMIGRAVRQADKLAALESTIRVHENQLSDLAERAEAISDRINQAEELKRELEHLQKKFEKADAWLHQLSLKLAAVDANAERMADFEHRVGQMETRLSLLIEKSPLLDQIDKRIERLLVAIEELAAKEKTLNTERDLVDRALTASVRLEQLLARAEQIQANT